MSVVTDSNSQGKSEQTGGVKVLILVGGPSKGTRFRPLSLEKPKPLFPVAGKPLIWHHMKACTQVPSLTEILLLGFYEESQEWLDFIASAEKEFKTKIRYLKEQSRMGTAGGLLHFKDEILKGNPDYFFVLHCDIICTFPLADLLSFHKQHGKEITIMGTKVPVDEARKYGCLAIEPKSNEVLHYAEKPQTFVSDIINCGIYLFEPKGTYKLLDGIVATHKKQEAASLRLEHDLLMNIVGEQHVYMFETSDFWLQLKAAGNVLSCSEMLLHQIRKTNPSALAAKSKEGPLILGDVLIDATAKVHPTAKIGPNVAIGANAVIGAGVRIANSIILDGVHVADHACILYSILGWDCVIGKWARIEGVPATPEYKGITILGTGVSVAAEVSVRSVIALPHKELQGSYNDEILL